MPLKKPYIRQLPVGPMANFVYLVGAEDSEEVVVVDASWEAERIWQVAREDNKRLGAVVLTHAHYDHVQALPELVELGLPVFLQQAEMEFAQTWLSQNPRALGPFCQRFGALLAKAPKHFRPVQPNACLPLAGLDMHMLLTPGHSVGSQCIWTGGALFSGDTLFVGACGRVDLPGGDLHALQQSLQVKLKHLPGETLLFPGHDYGESAVSSLSRERQHNPYMQDEESFLKRRGS